VYKETHERNVVFGGEVLLQLSTHLEKVHPHLIQS